MIDLQLKRLKRKYERNEIDTIFRKSCLHCFLFAGALAQAATVTGTVTNKTTGKPAAGDTVVLLDRGGMSEVAHATTDAQGHYTLDLPGRVPI